MVDVDNLVGTAEVAHRLGVSYRLVHNWLNRYDDFPTPVSTIGGLRIWNWPDIEAWARATGRL